MIEHHSTRLNLDIEYEDQSRVPAADTAKSDADDASPDLPCAADDDDASPDLHCEATTTLQTRMPPFAACPPALLYDRSRRGKSRLLDFQFEDPTECEAGMFGRGGVSPPRL
nr:hypothetical protein Iba_chr02bCG14280 [Ipomoea batatas]